MINAVKDFYDGIKKIFTVKKEKKNMERFDINNYTGKYVMHCKTRGESDKFRKYLDSVGRTWNSGDKYTAWDNWNKNRENTCYDFNNGMYDRLEYHKRMGYTILEFSDFMWPEFTKSDLKDGMVVSLRKGWKYLVVGDRLVSENDWLGLDGYFDDLIDDTFKEYDIVEVYKVKPSCVTRVKYLFDTTSLELIWERKEEPKPTHKYKVGDKVKVRSDLKAGITYGNIGFVPPMTEFIGKVVTIEKVKFTFVGTPTYLISENMGDWNWSDDMFEDGVVDYEEMTVEQIEKKLGYKVKIVDGE